MWRIIHDNAISQLLKFQQNENRFVHKNHLNNYRRMFNH
jgi:hypothetical protein